MLLKEADVRKLRGLQPETLDGSLIPNFTTILSNNNRENERKGSPRTSLQVLSDSAKGLGFEFYLSLTGLFETAAPVVEDARTLDYALRQKDFWYGDKAVQIKSLTRMYGSYAYLTEHMVSSVLKSVDLNDFFIFGISQIQGERNDGSTMFTHEPGFAISSETLKGLLHSGRDYIDVTDMHKRPDHYISLNRQLCLAEA